MSTTSRPASELVLRRHSSTHWPKAGPTSFGPIHASNQLVSTLEFERTAQSGEYRERVPDLRSRSSRWVRSQALAGVRFCLGCHFEGRYRWAVKRRPVYARGPVAGGSTGDRWVPHDGGQWFGSATPEALRFEDSVEEALPVGRHSIRWSWRWLVERVMLGRSQGGTLVEVTGCVVKEPLLVRFVASNHRMIGMLRVGSGMLTRRRVAATYVPAPCASPQVEPPPSRLKALCASVATGQHARVDRVIRHRSRISGRWRRLHGPGPRCTTRPGTPGGLTTPTPGTRADDARAAS